MARIKLLHPDFYEVLEYFSTDFRLDWCDPSDAKETVDANSGQYSSNADFVRNTPVFIYQSIGLATQGIHRPYLAKLLELTADMNEVSILDYGSGGGQIGLALHTLGYRVSFADIHSVSLMFLIWRLRQRKLSLPVYVLDAAPSIPRHNIAICFDVIEHCESFEEQIQILEHLGQLADCVFVNLIRGDGTELPNYHFAVDVDRLTNWVAVRWPKGVANDYYLDQNGVMKQRLLIYGDKVGTK